ncbi:MAG: hypothetical protein NTY37_10375 [Methanothrix sp.]|nr:hypothetical protein [Methanothrix sp.]
MDELERILARRCQLVEDLAKNHLVGDYLEQAKSLPSCLDLDNTLRYMTENQSRMNGIVKPLSEQRIRTQESLGLYIGPQIRMQESIVPFLEMQNRVRESLGPIIEKQIKMQESIRPFLEMQYRVRESLDVPSINQLELFAHDRSSSILLSRCEPEISRPQKLCEFDSESEKRDETDIAQSIQSLLITCNRAKKIAGKDAIFKYTDKFVEAIVTLSRLNSGDEQSLGDLVTHYIFSSMREQARTNYVSYAILEGH